MPGTRLIGQSASGRDNAAEVTDGGALKVSIENGPDITTASPASFNRGSVVRHAPCLQWSADLSGAGTGLLAPELTLRSASSLFVSQAGGNLLVNTGTTANAELLCRSTISFKGAIALRWRVLPSQRIANNSLTVLLADGIGESLAFACTASSATVTLPGHLYTSANIGQSMMLGAIIGAAGVPGRYAITGVDVDTVTFGVTGWPSNGSGTLDLFGHSYAQQLYSGTTNATLDAQRNGWSTTVLALPSTLYAATHSASIQLDGRTVAACRSSALGGDSLISVGSRSDLVPNEDRNLFVYLWNYNGSTAPISATTWTILSLSIEENANIPLYLAGMKQSGFGSPVAMTGNVSVAAMSAGTTLSNDVGMQYRASVAGGATSAKIISSAASPSSILKSGATRPLGWNLANTTASWVYGKLYNSITAGAGSAGVVIPIAIPPNGINSHFSEGGFTGFPTGLTFTTVTGFADSSATPAPDGAIVGTVIFA